jgi:hypothetical protein
MTGRMRRWAKLMHWRPCRNQRPKAGIALSAAAIRDRPARLLSAHIVFHAPLAQALIPGIPATPPVLTRVAQFFGNFRCHRRLVGGAHDVALEFAANIGKCRRSARKMGNRIGPQLAFQKASAAAPR